MKQKKEKNIELRFPEVEKILEELESGELELDRAI